MPAPTTPFAKFTAARRRDVLMTPPAGAPWPCGAGDDADADGGADAPAAEEEEGRSVAVSFSTD
jgi:hypothetical protein